MGSWHLGLSWFGLRWNVTLRWAKEKTVTQYGMTNRCADGLYVLFLDYDDTPLDWIMEEIALLHDRFPYALGSVHIFKTRNGYHAVALEKLPLELVIDMMRYSTCDKHYKDVPMMHGRKCWVLRSSPKRGEEIKYLGRLPGKEQDIRYDRSNAHRLFLERFYGLTKKDFTGTSKFDKEVRLPMAYYRVSEENA